MGIHNLDIQNKCLLSKWLFKLCNEDGLWQELLRNKYLKGQSLSQIEKKTGDSFFWSGLMGVKNHFLSQGTFKLVSGVQIRFWEDRLLGNHAFKLQYINLFNIVCKKHATVPDVFSSNPLNVSFRRTLVGNKLVEWCSLVARLAHISLYEGTNKFLWSLNKNMSFIIKSMYRHLINNRVI